MELPSSQQRDVIKSISPPWLQEGTNERVMYCFGLACDALLEKLNQAVKAHMPGLGTPTALPYIGRDRVMFQGPYESNESFANRLQSAFDAWQRAGSCRSVMSQAMSYVAGFNPVESGQLPRCAVIGDDYNGTYTTWHTYYSDSDIISAPSYQRKTTNLWNWDGTHRWWRNWLVLFFSPSATLQPEDTWGSGEWGQSGGSWGFNVESSFFSTLRLLVRLWKSTPTFYEWFIFSWNGGDGAPGSEFSPNSAAGAGNPDGTWKRWGKTVNGVYQQARTEDARFVDGTGIYENCTIPTGT